MLDLGELTPEQAEHIRTTTTGSLMTAILAAVEDQNRNGYDSGQGLWVSRHHSGLRGIEVGWCRHEEKVFIKPMSVSAVRTRVSGVLRRAKLGSIPLVELPK